MNKEEFIKEIKKLNVICTEIELSLLEKYYKLLIDWNNKFNLTRIIEEQDVYLKHFYDSLCIVKSIDLNKHKKIIDVGTGAGFPGIIISIFFKKIKVTLLESNNKKCTFLKVVKEELNLENLEIICERGEKFAKTNKEKFDIATCRAVSHLSIISEICIPLLKINGIFVPLKAELKEELEESVEKIKKLNAKIIEIKDYEIPKNAGKRNIPIIKKVGKTNEIYPREYNKIIKDLKNKKK